MSATALLVFLRVSIHQSDRGKLWQTFPGFQHWMFIIAGQQNRPLLQGLGLPGFCGLISSQTGSRMYKWPRRPTQLWCLEQLFSSLLCSCPPPC